MAYDNNDADISLSAGLQTSREYRLKISLMAYFQPAICDASGPNWSAGAKPPTRISHRIAAKNAAWRLK